MSRALARQGRALVGRKSTIQRMKSILLHVAEMPVIADVCRRNGIVRGTLVYWLNLSEANQPGFDIPTGDLDQDGQPITRRFHELWADALADGIDKVERAAFRLAYGQPEPLLSKGTGRVLYLINPDAVRLGLSEFDPAYYMRDENGKPIPETILKQDPDMIRFLLKSHKPEIYTPAQKVDVNHRGGVLVVGTQVKTSKEFDEQFTNKRDAIVDAEFEEVTDPTAPAGEKKDVDPCS